MTPSKLLRRPAAIRFVSPEEFRKGPAGVHVYFFSPRDLAPVGHSGCGSLSSFSLVSPKYLSRHFRARS